MTNKYSRTALLGILILTLIYACNNKVEKQTASNHLQQDSLDFAFHTKLKYAKGFTVTNHANYKEIYVTHPLTGDIMGRYITTLSADNLPDSVKAKGTVIEVPARSMAALSSTDIGCLEVLDIRDKLIGCGSPNNLWDKELQAKIARGEIKEIGRGMNFNIENIVAIMPEILIQNFMDKTDVDGNLSKLGINILYNNAWKEHNLLGRAEWLKFVALFFGRERMADSVFNIVEKNYHDVKAEAAKAKRKPTVMYGYDYKGTWYLPQNDTYVAQTIRDANAEFRGAGDGNRSIPKSFEEIYDIFNDCEYWLSTQGKVRTMKDFLSSNERYKDFQATANNKVYINNKREKPTGGNDYWESGINRPDLLLKDIVKILHPELFPNYETVYWRHLK